jgi:nucleotide-binding universal stress UspA family protein
MKRILVPVDGSEGSRLAIEMAKSIGEKYDSDLILLNAAPDAYIGRLEDHQRILSDQVNTERSKRGHQILDKAEAYLGEYQGSVEKVYKMGNISQEIVRYAKDSDVDLIIMGNRGGGVYSSTFLGSVANKVINRAPMAVLIAK